MTEGKVLLTIILVCLTVIAGITFYESQRRTEYNHMLLSFESRCTDKGGIVLQSLKGTTNWIGCYKGVSEIYNEEKE